MPRRRHTYLLLVLVLLFTMGLRCALQVYYEKRKRRPEKAASQQSSTSGSKKERKGSINNGECRRCCGRIYARRASCHVLCALVRVSRSQICLGTIR